jgi:hypothetical protein
MRDDSSRAQAASAVLAALMLTQSALGLLFPGAYRDVAWIRATWYGNDWVTLAVAVPALAGALLLARCGSVRGRLLWLGLLGYGVYNYALYAVGAALNAFFPLYVALLVLAAATLRLAVRDADAEGIARAFRRRTPARVVGAYVTLVATGLAGVWLALWAAYAFAGKRTPVEPEVFKLVAALDLTLMVPALATGGVLLWRRRPWGYVVASAAAVQGVLYLLVLAVNSLVAVARGLTPAPGEAPLWGTLALLTAGAAGLLLANVRPEAAMRPLEPLTPPRAAPRSSRTRPGRRRALWVTHDESRA